MDKIYGNAHALECIDRAVNGGKLHHAYLIYGEKGLGKRKLAAYFAKTVLCHAPHRPCGNCPSCNKLDAGAHPDIQFVDGEGAKNELTVAKIREIKAEAYIRPNDGDYKVFVLANCHKMQAPAANALLKLLEEPPEFTVLLLTAASRSALPETIVSRCLQIGAYAVDEYDCTQAIMRLGEADQDRARKIAASCGGNIGKGLDMLHSAEQIVSPETFCEYLAGRQEYMLLVTLNKMAGDKKAYREFLTAISEQLRDALVIKSGSNKATVCSQKVLKKLAAAYSVKRLMMNFRVISKALQKIDENANIAVLNSWIVSQLMENETAHAVGK